jgi:Mg2+/Co2+ transporter CorB
VVNIGATAIVTDAATAMFGEAGVSAATGVMTVRLLYHTCLVQFSLHKGFRNPLTMDPPIFRLPSYFLQKSLPKVLQYIMQQRLLGLW